MKRKGNVNVDLIFEISQSKHLFGINFNYLQYQKMLDFERLSEMAALFDTL